jgi:hydrogenase small subunit
LNQAANPTTAELFLKTISVQCDEALTAVRSLPQSGYILVIDGAIPMAEDGIYCTSGGRSMRDVVAEASANALGTIAVGSCAFDGGASAAAGGSSGAVGAGRVVRSPTLINLPGCPVNVANLAATVIHYFTFHEFPATDGLSRPLFAYGGQIHNQCERRAHFEFGEFVHAWGDEGAQKGWCLYKLGCKGPETFANCPTQKYADGASWSVLAGHGCVGCTMPAFWDAMGSAYDRLPAPVGVLPDVSADERGLALVAGVTALATVHGGASMVRQKVAGRRKPRPPEPAQPTEPVEPTAEADTTAEAETTEPAEPMTEPAEPMTEPPAELEAEVAEPAEPVIAEIAADEAVPETVDQATDEAAE